MASFTHARILFPRIALKGNLLDKKNRDWVIISKWQSESNFHISLGFYYRESKTLAKNREVSRK